MAMTTPKRKDPGCVFCRTPAQEILFSDGSWYARFDRHPVTPGHILAIPVRHCPAFSDLEDEETQKLLLFVSRCREFVDARFHPQGYNIGANIGTAAGQTVSHIHVHIIPRYLGDHPDPRGGIRAVIPGCTLLPFTEGITEITGIPDATCIEETFADLTDDTGVETILRAGASEAVLVTDGESVPLAVALKTPDGWCISSSLLNRQGNQVQEKYSAVGGRICRTTRPLWMRGLKEYYSRKIIGSIPPMAGMSQTGRTEFLSELFEEIWGGTVNSACLDCCCGSGTGSAVLRSRGMKPVSYDNQPAQLALGFLRGNLEADETCCIDATIASRYIEPAEYGTGLMLGDINGTNAGIWEQIVRELLMLSQNTVITVVSEREIRRVGRWCRENDRDVEIFENTRHPLFDHWVCSAHPHQ